VATPTLSDSPAVQQQYLAQLALTAALVQAIHNLWPIANPLTNPAKFSQALGLLVGQLGQVSASIAQDFYLGARAEAGVSGVPALRLVPPVPQSKIDAGIGWAMRHREEAQRTEAEIMARVEAAMQKALADIGREQIVTAVEGDEFAIGYRRVPRPGACYFCLVQALRKTHRAGRAVNRIRAGRAGADFDPNVEHYGVYKSRAAAGQIAPNAQGDTNRFHNNCHCVVEPIFFPVNTLPDWLHNMERLYAESTADSKSGRRLNDFRRALAAQRSGVTPPTPTAPVIAASASNSERIAKLLDLLPKVA
jgi:hypothetical protein